MIFCECYCLFNDTKLETSWKNAVILRPFSRCNKVTQAFLLQFKFCPKIRHVKSNHLLANQNKDKSVQSVT